MEPGKVVAFGSTTDAALDVWIGNHEKWPDGRALPLYRLLLEERARRADARQSLKTDRSIEHLKAFAIAGRCTTYGALAAASGVAWSKARQRMNGASGHLERVLDICHARGLPLLTAICVNRDGVETAQLSDDARRGFAAGARRIGATVEDERAFHRDCVEACWAWGRRQPTAGP